MSISLFAAFGFEAFALRTYTDPFDFHDRVRSMATQARRLATNGDDSNRVMLLFPGPGAPPPSQYQDLALEKMDQWLAAIRRDDRPGSVRKKILRSKPADRREGCYTSAGDFIAERLTYDGQGACNSVYPAHMNPRMVAGSPLAGDIPKYDLKRSIQATIPHSWRQVS